MLQIIDIGLPGPDGQFALLVVMKVLRVEQGLAILSLD